MSIYLVKMMLITCGSTAVMLWLVDKLLPDWGMHLTLGQWLLWTAPLLIFELVGIVLVHSKGEA